MINFYLSAGIIIFLVSFLLFETDSEHPPALGIAIAFLIFRISSAGILVLIVGIIILVLFKMLLQRFGILSKASEFRVR